MGLLMQIEMSDAYYESIFKIDYDKLKKIGIKYLFFDIDNTIIPYKELEPNKETLKLFKELKKDFNVYLFSNSMKKRVLKISKELDIDAYYFSMKPLKINYKKIMNVFHKNECVFIGDQFMTDILGSKRMNLKVILVDRLLNKEPLPTKFWRFFERFLLKKYEKNNEFKKYRYYDNVN